MPRPAPTHVALPSEIIDLGRLLRTYAVNAVATSGSLILAAVTLWAGLSALVNAHAPGERVSAALLVFLAGALIGAALATFFYSLARTRRAGRRLA